MFIYIQNILQNWVKINLIYQNTYKTKFRSQIDIDRLLTLLNVNKS